MITNKKKRKRKAVKKRATSVPPQKVVSPVPVPLPTPKPPQVDVHDKKKAEMSDINLEEDQWEFV